MCRCKQVERVDDRMMMDIQSHDTSYRIMEENQNENGNEF